MAANGMCERRETGVSINPTMIQAISAPKSVARQTGVSWRLTVQRSVGKCRFQPEPATRFRRHVDDGFEGSFCRALITGSSTAEAPVTPYVGPAINSAVRSCWRSGRREILLAVGSMRICAKYPIVQVEAQPKGSAREAPPRGPQELKGAADCYGRAAKAAIQAPRLLAIRLLLSEAPAGCHTWIPRLSHW
jgi:hypothetical protein